MSENNVAVQLDYEHEHTYTATVVFPLDPNMTHDLEAQAVTAALEAIPPELKLDAMCDPDVELLGPSELHEGVFRARLTWTFTAVSGRQCFYAQVDVPEPTPATVHALDADFQGYKYTLIFREDDTITFHANEIGKPLGAALYTTRCGSRMGVRLQGRLAGKRRSLYLARRVILDFLEENMDAPELETWL